METPACNHSSARWCATFFFASRGACGFASLVLVAFYGAWAVLSLLVPPLLAALLAALLPPSALAALLLLALLPLPAALLTPLALAAFPSLALGLPLLPLLVPLVVLPLLLELQPHLVSWVPLSVAAWGPSPQRLAW